jgi:hypothetical protein
MLLGALICAPMLGLFAQTTGSLTGTVTDGSGAVVPKAHVTLTNTVTKDVRHTVSNEVGYFAFTALPASTYTVRVDSSDFRPWEEKGIVLEARDHKTVQGIALQVRSASDTTTVEAVASAVQIVDSGDLSASLTSKEIMSMALEGRDVTELVKTLPGFNNTTGYGSVANTSGYNPQITSIGSAIGNGYSANGSPDRAGGVSLTSDGANVLDPGCNCNATQTINPETVQEVKVTTSAYGADNAHGPVSVQAIGKSGTSEFHGSGYFHARNASMNANDWDAKHNLQARPDDHYYYPGATLSGPVLIPGTNFNKQRKLLFFSQYEYYNQAFPDQDEASGILKSVVPTSDMLAGNFNPTSANNQALCSFGGWQPYCGGVSSVTLNGVTTPITNNQLPSTLLDPVMAKYMGAVIPSANANPATSGGYNYVHLQESGGTGWMTHHKVDYSINDTNKLMVSLNFQRDTQQVPVMQWWAPGDSVPNPGGQAAIGKSQTIAATYTHIFNNTMTNELTFTLAHLRMENSYQNEKRVDRTAVGYTYPTWFGQSNTLPALTNGWWIPGIPMFFQSDNNGYFSEKWAPGFSESLSKLYKRHTFKAGVSWERSANNQMSYSANNVGTNGQLTFGTWGATGNPVANMVMGAPTSYSETTSRPVTYMDYWSLGFFAQDEWKVSKHLSLTYGLRISHDTPWQDDSSAKLGAAVWSPALYASDVSGATQAFGGFPGLRWHAVDKSIPVAGRTLDSAFVSPRVGLAYDVFGTGKTVFRGGWGAYYFHDQFNDYAGPVAVGQQQKACTANFWQQGMSAIAAAKPSSLSSCAATGASAVDASDHKEPVTYSYSAAISQQMSRSNLLELRYVGNRSLHLQNPLQNVNVAPLGAIGNGGNIAPDPLNGKTPTMYDLESKKNGFDPNDYRPYPQYYGALDVVHHGAWANYNAMQISLSHLRGWVTYQLNYTWSKTLGINGLYNSQPDPINIHNDYGIMSSDRAHVLNAVYSFELSRKRFSNSLVNGVLSNWVFSGISGIQSGAPLQQNWKYNWGMTAQSPITNGSDTAVPYYVDALSVLGSPDYTLMPMVNCNPTKGLGSHQYFNFNCYSAPGFGQQGPYGQYVRGPGYWNTDLTLSKTVKLTERQNVQFKVTAINFLNHPLWSFNPGSTANMQLTYQPTSNSLSSYAGYNPGGANSQLVPAGQGITYGQTSEKFGRRVMELSMWYHF